MTDHICVLTHGDAPNVEACIEGIRSTTQGKSQTFLIVFGQALTASALGRIKALQKTNPLVAYLYTSKQNLMAIGGRQRLLDLINTDLALGDVVIMLDDDVVPTLLGWDVMLNQAARKYGVASQVAANIRPDWTDFEEPPTDLDSPGLYDVAGGGATAYQAHFFLQHDGLEYDQGFLPFWHADADLSLQAREMGAQVWWTGDIGLKHDFNHRVHDFYWKRNMLKLRRKWKGKLLIHAESTNR